MTFRLLIGWCLSTVGLIVLSVATTIVHRILAGDYRRLVYLGQTGNVLRSILPPILSRRPGLCKRVNSFALPPKISETL